MLGKSMGLAQGQNIGMGKIQCIDESIKRGVWRIGLRHCAPLREMGEEKTENFRLEVGWRTNEPRLKRAAFLRFKVIADLSIRTNTLLSRRAPNRGLSLEETLRCLSQLLLAHVSGPLDA